MKKILIIICALIFSSNIRAQPMELEFNTEVSPGTTITLPLYGITSVTINWGDSNEETITTSADIEHTYASEGTYQVTISGSFSKFGKGWESYNNADKLIKVISFGDVGLTNLSGAFRDAVNLIELPIQIPSTITNMSFMFYNASSFNQDLPWDVSNVTSMNAMFREATSFNGDINDWNVESVTTMSAMFAYAENFNQDISNWNVSNVTDMYSIFYNATSFNGDISSWDVSNVQNMSFMFYRCADFNQTIGSWDVSHAETMAYMFIEASSFNQDISAWNVSNVTTMTNMFREASSFNQDINSWDVSNVENMVYMFCGADNFNQDLNNWDVSLVSSMERMFYDALSFNGDISSWDVSNVTNMTYMFYNAENFNQDIGNWNVGNVTNMSHMFLFATKFNQDLGNWDVGNVTDMSYMFSSATNFNQDLGNWNMSNVENVTEMFASTTLSTAFYNNLLIGWAGQSLQNNLTFNAGNAKYSPGDAATARQEIIDNFNWDILDGGLSELPAVVTSEVINVNDTSAVTGGEVMTDGGYPVTSIGVVWDISEEPTLLNNEGYTEDEYIEGTYEFVSEMNMLVPLTKYYVRAYATNSEGTTYGNTFSFTTTKTLTIAGTFTVFDKTYDGNMEAEIDENNLTLEGVSGSDDVELTAVVVAFETAEPGENVLVTINDATLEGLDAENYILSLEGSPTTEAQIARKEITIKGSFTVVDKSYDGTTEAEIDENNLVLDGVIASDDVELTDIHAVFETAEPGENILVTIEEATLEGNDADWYQLSLENSPTTVANITQAVNVDKVYFDHIIIYPNPFADYLTLKNAEGTLQISIIDALGNVVLKEKDYDEDIINTSDFKSGLYFLVISKANQKRVFKLIKQ